MVQIGFVRTITLHIDDKVYADLTEVAGTQNVNEYIGSFSVKFEP